MAPDLNSLPSSRSQPSRPPINPHALNGTSTPDGDGPPALQSGSVASSTTSINTASSGMTASTALTTQSTAQAGAGPGAGGGGSPRHRGSPRIERRRSSILGSWALNDGSGVPGSPGTATAGTMDPFHQHHHHHHRAPSIGELHQELENEQEAQVNRLLAMIRDQQNVIAQYQSQHPNTSITSNFPTPTSLHSSVEPHASSHHHAIASPSLPLSLSRRTSTARSRTPSRTSSPIIRPAVQQHTAVYTPPSELNPEWPSSASNQAGSSTLSGSTAVHNGAEIGTLAVGHATSDPAATGRNNNSSSDTGLQHENSVLQRENVMLKARVAELQRRVTEMEGLGMSAGTTARERAQSNASGRT